MGEVDIDLRLHLRILDQLKPPPTGFQRRDHRLDRVVRYACGLGERRRDENVRLVVVADKLQARQVIRRPRPARIARSPRHRDDIHRQVADGIEHLPPVAAVQTDDVGRKLPPPRVRRGPMRRSDLTREIELRVEIRLHRLVIVEMVFRQVRERTARKDRVARPVLVDRVRRDLHHAVRAAVRLHRRENLPELGERGRRVARVEPLRPVKDLDRRDVPALTARNRVDERRRDPRRGGLAVRARYAPVVQSRTPRHSSNRRCASFTYFAPTPPLTNGSIEMPPRAANLP